MQPQPQPQTMEQVLAQNNAQLLGNILTALNSAAIQSYIMRPVISSSPTYIQQVKDVLEVLTMMYNQLEEAANATPST